MSGKGQTTGEDDPMFSKKHLCGFSCACCENNLENL